jgi:predicted DNA-binding antitoxin AbrB/MazE fold protein
MSTVIEATYDGKVLTPVSALDLKLNTRYRLQVIL